MTPAALSLVHTVVPPRTSTTGDPPGIVLLHGRGTDENDLLGLSDALDGRLMVISARAPYRFEFGGWTWFRMAGEALSADEATFRQSYGTLDRFLDEVVTAYKIDPRRLFLLGFSMGTIMAYAIALTKPEKVRGVVAQSGFAAELPYLDYRWQSLKGCSFFAVHGTQDTVIPVSMAQRTARLFAASNAPFLYREYSMGHQISGESLGDIAAWLSEVIDGSDDRIRRK